MMYHSVSPALRPRACWLVAAGLLMFVLGTAAAPNMASAQDAPTTDAAAQETPPTDAQPSDAQPSAGDDNAAAAEPSESGDAGSVDEATTPAEESSGASDAEAATEDEEKSWYDHVDATFGAYVTKPIGDALSYSFGTEYLFGRKIPFVVVWLFCGALFLTIRMSFVNIRCFWHAIRLTKGDYDDKSDPGEVSHFQALSSALSATVGLGNIAGVAIAVGTGGPGAIFWMVLIGLLGMSSKFTECTLGQMYRRVNEDGTVSGGAMIYLHKGLKDIGLGPLGAVLAIIFSVLCILASFGGGNAFQVGQSLDALRADVSVIAAAEQEGATASDAESASGSDATASEGEQGATKEKEKGFLDKYPVVYGLTMALFAGLVIIGGIKSIGHVASLIVPFMCIAYVAMALYIIGTNLDEVPAAFGVIIGSAWSMQAGFGGLLGVLVLGIKRAVFSNEAGTGSAAIAHSAAKTDEPVSEGIVALLEPFIDTVLVCTMTGLVIVIAGGVWTPNEELPMLKIGDPIVAEASAETEADSSPVADAVADAGTDAEAKEVPKINYEFLEKQPLGTWSNPVYQKFAGEGAGASLTLAAVSGKKGLPAFRWLLYASVVLFAFSTIISWSYYGERCWTNLFGPQSSMVYKVIFLGFTVLGSIVTKGNILEFSDALILGMSFPNMVGLYLLSGKVRRELDKYTGKLKSGEIAPNK
ncbi:MAG: alanine:cation symporter family protein [Pirellulaceae bacterium]